MTRIAKWTLKIGKKTVNGCGKILIFKLSGIYSFDKVVATL